MNHLEQVFSCFPQVIQNQINTLDPFTKQHMEEIRIYRQKEVQLFAAGRHIQLNGRISGIDINNILNNLMKFSYYAYEEDLSKGFITIDGGHRVGICGKVVLEKGKVRLLREISSLNIRHAREVVGCSDLIMQHIIDTSSTSSNQSKLPLHNILIVSPPGCGKTTLLRDIARHLSLKSYKVAICDERSEIAGMHGGMPSYQFGSMVDVLDGCPKAEGMMMLIRSMSPDVIITDEIGKTEDLDAIKTCINCGVNLITSIHGNDIDDLKRSEIYPAIENKTFTKIIFLTDQPKVGSIEDVIDVEKDIIMQEVCHD